MDVQQLHSPMINGASSFTTEYDLHVPEHAGTFVFALQSPKSTSISCRSLIHFGASVGGTGAGDAVSLVGSSVCVTASVVGDSVLVPFLSAFLWVAKDVVDINSPISVTAS